MEKQMILRAAVARLFYGNNRNSRDFDMLIDFIDGAFQQKNPWIPVTDRLPKKEDANRRGDVLVCLLGTCRHQLWSLDLVVNNPDCISHWMPLPEPTEEV